MYFQTITAGGAWMTADQEWSNMVLNELTDDMFAVPSDCTRQCLGDEHDMIFSKIPTADMATLNLI